MTETSGRIKALLPAHFHTDEDTILNKLIECIAIQLDDARANITNLMKSKWVDFCNIKDLEKLAALFNIKRLKQETDTNFRQRLKDTVREMLRSTCTPDAIQKLVEAMIGIKPEIIENPQVLRTTQEFYLYSGQRWAVRSNGIKVVNPTITIRALETVRNPTVINLNAEEAVTCRGVLRKGAYLIINSDCSANVGGIDISDTIKSTSPHTPPILKGDAEWCYTDATALFNTAKFDTASFGAHAKHTVGITLKWDESQAAVFLVKMPLYTKKGDRKTISFESELRQEVKKVVDSIKPAGVIAKVNYWDDFSEHMTEQRDFFTHQFGTENTETHIQKDEELALNAASDFSEKQHMGDTVSIGSAFDIAKFNLKFRFE